MLPWFLTICENIFKFVIIINTNHSWKPLIITWIRTSVCCQAEATVFPTKLRIESPDFFHVFFYRCIVLISRLFRRKRYLWETNVNNLIYLWVKVQRFSNRNFYNLQIFLNTVPFRAVPLQVIPPFSSPQLSSVHFFIAITLTSRYLWLLALLFNCVSYLSVDSVCPIFCFVQIYESSYIFSSRVFILLPHSFYIII